MDATPEVKEKKEKDYFRQKCGVSNTKRVKISSRPNNIAKHKTPSCSPFKEL